MESAAMVFVASFHDLESSHDLEKPLLVDNSWGTYLTAAVHSHARDNGLHEGTDGNASDINLLFTVFLCNMTLGTILMCFLSKRDDEVESHNLLATLVSLPMSLIHPLFDIRRLLIIPPWHIQDYNKHLWVEFTKYIVKPMLGMSGVGGEMAVYGAFDAVSITLIVTGGTLVHAAIFIWLLLFLQSHSSSSGLVGIMNLLIMSALLGIGNGVFNTQLTFAQLKVWQCGAVALIFFISPYISLQAILVLTLSAICLSYASFLFLYR
ncbi:hypothetical protein C1H46_012668 [Malus baccata]|uniref:Uncharacterized protein n=1 Tax=Malus baccata TaxID=106549 RepID=A0A540MSG6_MALBA|nr:hypothetical protein C1H46_012668 [Malus baccata]